MSAKSNLVLRASSSKTCFSKKYLIRFDFFFANILQIFIQVSDDWNDGCLVNTSGQYQFYYILALVCHVQNVLMKRFLVYEFKGKQFERNVETFFLKHVPGLFVLLLWKACVVTCYDDYSWKTVVSAFHTTKYRVYVKHLHAQLTKWYLQCSTYYVTLWYALYAIVSLPDFPGYQNYELSQRMAWSTVLNLIYL